MSLPARVARLLLLCFFWFEFVIGFCSSLILAPVGRPVLVLIANAGLIAVEELSPTGADLRLYGFLRFGLPQLRSELAHSVDGILW